MERGRRYAVIMALGTFSACGGKVTGAVFRPIASVDAKDTADRDSATMHPGEVLIVKLVVYTPTNASFDDPGVSWVSRNPLVASVAVSRVTAKAAGSTFIVGEIADEGRVFRDSIPITVVP